MQLGKWNMILFLAIVLLKHWISTSLGGILCCDRCIPSLVWNLEIHLYREDGGKTFLRNVFIHRCCYKTEHPLPVLDAASIWNQPYKEQKQTLMVVWKNWLVYWTEFIAINNHCLGRFPIIWVTVKQSHNRPGVAQRVPGGLGSQISWHSTHEDGEVSLTHWPPLPPGMFLVLIFTRCWVDPRAMVRSEAICHWKIQWHQRESIPGPSD
jgi:hypothetical protein